jgi:type IV secretion system protein VirB5
MKLRPVAIACLLSVSAIGAVQASLPVIDIANLTQAISQVNAWKQQYDQMAQQYTQLKQQYAAMTGTRNLGNIANNPALQAVIPPDVADLYASIQQTGSGGMTPLAQAIRGRTKIYDCEGRFGADLVSCQALLNNTVQLQALSQNAMSVVNQRVAQIQALQNQISATNDAKAIAELQARLQAENTQVSNDANRLMVMKTLAEAADRSAQQAIKERELKNLALTSDGSDTFVYVPFSHRH